MPIGEHIADEVLLDYLEDRLDAAGAAQVRDHLDSGCAQCAGELDSWKSTLTALAADCEPGPPEALRQWAFALFGRVGPKPSVLERIVAKLRFDSRLQPVLAGARNVGGPAFQLLYAAGDTDVDLLCEPDDGSWQITGQASADQPPELGWRVSAASQLGEFRTDTNDRGEFRLQGLAPGSYDVALRETRREIVMPEIELPEP
jgi:hypothetical protein